MYIRTETIKVWFIENIENICHAVLSGGLKRNTLFYPNKDFNLHLFHGRTVMPSQSFQSSLKNNTYRNSHWIKKIMFI